jgi:hypothetical protein
LDTNKKRAEDEADLQHTRTQQTINEQIDDTARIMEQEVSMGEMAGALSGNIRSS